MGCSERRCRHITPSKKFNLYLSQLDIPWQRGWHVNDVEHFSTRQNVALDTGEIVLPKGKWRADIDQLASVEVTSEEGRHSIAVRPKSVNTIPIVEHYVRDYLIERFGEQIAEDIKPLEIQKWLKSLNESNGLACTTIAKMRGTMHRISKIGILHELVTKNLVQHVETRSKSSYRGIIISPRTYACDPEVPLFTAPFHASADLRRDRAALFEILALRWSDTLWGEGRIRISKRWAKGKDGETKTDASDGYVPMHPVLAGHLRTWHRQTLHAKPDDFVFPSIREQGRKPLYASSFVADYLRPAAKRAGVPIEDGQKFGLHNLRHSLSNWCVWQVHLAHFGGLIWPTLSH
jgi:integrase